MESFLVLFECDPETHEALGAAHAFCSQRCQEEFAPHKLDYPGAVLEPGTSTEDDFGFTPKCESCGCFANWRTGPRSPKGPGGAR